MKKHIITLEERAVEFARGLVPPEAQGKYQPIGGDPDNCVCNMCCATLGYKAGYAAGLKARKRK